MAARYGPYRRSFPIIFIGLLAVLGGVQSEEFFQKSSHEGKALCAKRSGHSHLYVKDVRWRNNGCALDCIMFQGLMVTHHMDDRTPCHRDGYQCYLGGCRSPEDYVKPAQELQDVQIKIISAYVEDKDLSPTAGESDVYIMVTMYRNGEPTYQQLDDICFTYIIQDSNRPVWKDFVCKPLPIPTLATLRFYAYDSDKPFNNPDPLGRADEKLGYLLNRGPTKLPLVGFGKNDINTRYWVEVDVTGEEYDAFGKWKKNNTAY